MRGGRGTPYTQKPLKIYRGKKKDKKSIRWILEKDVGGSKGAGGSMLVEI
jgi:hypothetical protein